MTIEYIRYELRTNAPEALIEAYRLAGEHLKNAPECLGFELTQCEESPNCLVLRIRWQSTEAHMEGFRKGANFPAFLALIRPFVGEIAEMRHYQETAVQWMR